MGPLGIIGIVLGAIVLLLIVEEVFVEIEIRKMFNHRGDGCLRFYYTLPSDFPHLNQKKVYIKSRRNTIIGIEYKDKSIKQYKGVVLFSHGIGAGHEYILKLINKFCLDGYIVFAYDHSGSMRSTGTRVKDLTQCLSDVERVYRWFEKQEEYKKYDFYVVGHSWGGFTAMNALNIRGNRFKKCIAIAGFNSNINQSLFGNAAYKFLAPGMFIYDVIHHGKYAFWSSSRALRHTKAEVLCLHGEYDRVVSLEYSYKKYLKISKKHKNIRVLLYKEKGHSPFLTKESERKQGDYSNGLGILGQGEPAYNLCNDYKKTYHLDEEFVNDMLKFINK